jgi:hypothetical protein
VTMLVDTGAGRTMLSPEVLGELQNCGSNCFLKSTRTKLVTASGDVMPVEGAVEVEINVGECILKETHCHGCKLGRISKWGVGDGLHTKHGWASRTMCWVVNLRQVLYFPT